LRTVARAKAAWRFPPQSITPRANRALSCCSALPGRFGGRPGRGGRTEIKTEVRRLRMEDGGLPRSADVFGCECWHRPGASRRRGEASRLSGLILKYEHVRCVEFGLWCGARFPSQRDVMTLARSFQRRVSAGAVASPSGTADVGGKPGNPQLWLALFMGWAHGHSDATLP